MDTKPDAGEFDVPADFPRTERAAAVSGFQNKLVVSSYGGKYYAPGCTPPEVFARWDRCEDLAKQLTTKSLESKAGKRAHMSEMEILDQYHVRLKATGWVSDAEGGWVIRRAAEMLGGWPVPASICVPIDNSIGAGDGNGHTRGKG